MQKNLLIVTLILLVGLGIGYQMGSGNDLSQRQGAHMMPDGSMMGQNIDQHFIVQMIPHHEGAIAMARLALERSKRPEMLSLANDIIEAQQKEIDNMRSWYGSWFGSAPPAGGTSMMHMGGMTGDLEILRSISADQFDREFIIQMIPHHEMAIMMAQMLLASTEKDEMKELGNNIITSQAREIQMMRSWLDSWY